MNYSLYIFAYFFIIQQGILFIFKVLDIEKLKKIIEIATIFCSNHYLFINFISILYIPIFNLAYSNFVLLTKGSY